MQNREWRCSLLVVSDNPPPPKNQTNRHPPLHNNVCLLSVHLPTVKDVAYPPWLCLHYCVSQCHPVSLCPNTSTDFSSFCYATRASLISSAPSILFSETPSSLFHSPHFSLVADCSPVSPSPALPAVCGSLAQCWSFPPARSPESCSGSSSLWTSTQKNRWNLCYNWYKRHN